MKQIIFPIRILFTIDKKEEHLELLSGKIKFGCKLDEYPELPMQSLVNKMTLTDEEKSQTLEFIKIILKKHLKEVV